MRGYARVCAAMRRCLRFLHACVDIPYESIFAFMRACLCVSSCIHATMRRCRQERALLYARVNACALLSISTDMRIYACAHVRIYAYIQQRRRPSTPLCSRVAMQPCSDAAVCLCVSARGFTCARICASMHPCASMHSCMRARAHIGMEAAANIRR
jgi:hypothetical protein